MFGKKRKTGRGYPARKGNDRIYGGSGTPSDYEALFIRPSPVKARAGKMVYIRTEFHDTIQRITQVIGGGSLPLSAFIDNVLSHHFNTYREEIERLYESKHTGVFIKKGK